MKSIRKYFQAFKTRGLLLMWEPNRECFLECLRPIWYRKSRFFQEDTEKDKLFRLDVDRINKYIGSLPPDIRHWIQMLDTENFIKKIILYLMPRLEYTL